MMGYYDGTSFFGGFFMVFFWILIIWGIFAVIRMLSGGTSSFHQHSWRQDNAISILKERYARGEIDKTEYEEKKRVLESDKLG